jgi:hypothetical protein
VRLHSLLPLHFVRESNKSLKKVVKPPSPNPSVLLSSRYLILLLLFPLPFLQGIDEIHSITITLTTDQNISHDSIPAVVQTVQDHQVATAPSTPTTELRSYARNQIHVKGLTRFSPQLFLQDFFLISEKLEPNHYPPLADPSPSPTTEAAPAIEDSEDDGECNAKVVPKAPPVDSPTTDDAFVIPNPTATGEEFPGLSIHSTSSTPHFLFFEHSSEIETTSTPPVTPRSAPSSCSRPLSAIQPVLVTGCESSDPLHSPPWHHSVSPPSPLKVEPEPMEPPTPTDDDDPPPLPPAPGDVDETTLVIERLLCGNSPFEIRDSRQVPEGMINSPTPCLPPLTPLSC